MNSYASIVDIERIFGLFGSGRFLVRWRGDTSDIKVEGVEDPRAACRRIVRNGHGVAVSTQQRNQRQRYGKVVRMSDTLALETLGLLSEFWDSLDRGDADHVISFLTEDVDWALASGLKGQVSADNVTRLKGKVAVAGSLKDRPDNLVVRHLVSNVVVRPRDGDLDVTFVMTVFGLLAAPGATVPYPTPSPLLVDGKATLIKAGGKLLISRLSVDWLFYA
jgi:hypothetical protein